jgi:hypothetical protein
VRREHSAEETGQISLAAMCRVHWRARLRAVTIHNSQVMETAKMPHH